MELAIILFLILFIISAIFYVIGKDTSQGDEVKEEVLVKKGPEPVLDEQAPTQVVAPSAEQPVVSQPVIEQPVVDQPSQPASTPKKRTRKPAAVPPVPAMTASNKKGNRKIK